MGERAGESVTASLLMLLEGLASPPPVMLAVLLTMMIAVGCLVHAVPLLAEHGPLSIGEIATEPAEFSAALECVALLIDRAAVALVINDSVDERIDHACRAVNERLSRLAQTQPEVTVRAHPVYGVGEPTG